MHEPKRQKSFFSYQLDMLLALKVTFDPDDLNNNRGCLLVKTKFHAKFEVCRSKCSRVINRTSSTTDGQTNMCKHILYNHWDSYNFCKQTRQKHFIPKQLLATKFTFAI